MLAWLKIVWFNPARDWIAVFLAILALVQIDGATNTYSRWATMASIIEDKTVRIDHYYTYTMDWARTPDGHYYSNKAPGPALIGLPLFWYLDREIVRYSDNRPQRDAERLLARNAVMQKVSIWTQAVPYALVVLLFVEAMKRRGLPKAALHFTAAALLFGNTPALLMGLYFGHAMGAMFVLAALLALHYKRYAQVGLYLGFALLSDYGAAMMLIPTAALLLWQNGARFRRFGWFCAGGVLPGAIWSVYHWYCFGSPFSPATKYQNPIFVDAGRATTRIWGSLQLVPNKPILMKLLWGEGRGLLYSQGWLLVAIVGLAVLLTLSFPNRHFRFTDALLRDTAVISFVGLALLLVTNSAYNGWHGGATPGPRYLSAALPGCAVAAGLIYPRLPAFARHAMVAFLGLSSLLFLLFFATKSIYVPESMLFSYYLPTTTTIPLNLQRALYLLVAFSWAAFGAFADARTDDVTSCDSDTPT